MTNSAVAGSHEYLLNNVKGPFTFANEAARIAFAPPRSAIGSWAFVTSTGKIYCLFNVNAQTGLGWWALVPSYLQKPNDYSLVVDVESGGQNLSSAPNTGGTAVTGYTAVGTINTWTDANFPYDIQPSYLVPTTAGATKFWWRVPVSLPGGFAGGTYVLTFDCASSTNLGSFNLLDGSKAPFGSNWGAFSSGTPTVLSPYIDSNSTIAPTAVANGEGAPTWGTSNVGGRVDSGGVYSQPLNGIVCTGIPAGATTIQLYFSTDNTQGSGNKGFIILKRIYFNQ